ncbi:MAG: glycogen synthase GlgA, partial [Crocosphaera sp.]
RRTGGLRDTVSFYDPINEAGSGYCFDNYEPLELLVSMIRAWEGFRFKTDWRKLQQRCMTQDFSWYKSAAEYIKIYKELSGQPGELTPEEEDKMAFLIKKNISWDIHGNETLNQDVAEKKTENNYPVSTTEVTEISTASQEETPIVESGEQKEVAPSIIITSEIAVEKEEETQNISNEVPEESLSQTTTIDSTSSDNEVKDEEQHECVSDETSTEQSLSHSTSQQTDTTETEVEVQQSPLSTDTIKIEESLSKPTANEIPETTKESSQPTSESKADAPKLKPRPSLPSPTVESPS